MTSAGPELSPRGLARQVLDLIYEHLNQVGRWPSFGGLDRTVDALGGDLVEILDSLAVSRVRRDRSGGAAQASETLSLTLTGLLSCSGSSEDLALFAAVTAELARIELAHDASAEGASDEPTVRMADVLAAVIQPTFEADQRTRHLVHALLYSEHLLWQAIQGGPEDDWTVTLQRNVRRFRRVKTIEDYLRVRDTLLQTRTGLGAEATLATPNEVPPQVPPQAAMIPLTNPSPEVILESPPMPDPRTVFVVHGRDTAARDAMFGFLRDLDLRPLEWDALVNMTGSGSPFTGEVVARAFQEAQAVVVLMTPDDEARLHASLRSDKETAHEVQLTGQARPNVLLEAGMALGANPDHTILVEMGSLRPVSDLAGRNVVRLGQTASPLNALANRLEKAGCPVDRSSPGWMDPERFAELAAHSRTPSVTESRDSVLPKGRILAGAKVSPAARLTAVLHDRGKNDHLLEVTNRGGLSLTNVSWTAPEDVSNWGFLNDVLPEYPVAKLEPGEHVRVPTSITTGGPAVIDLRIEATAPDGSPYTTTARLSIYG